MWYKDDKTFYTMEAIRLELKNMNLPIYLSDTDLIALGFTKVVIPEPPVVTDVQLVMHGPVVLVDNIPTLTYNIIDKFTDIVEDGVVTVTKQQQEEEYLARLNAVRAEEAKEDILSRLKITTSSGKVFYADLSSRVDISNAIQLAQAYGITEKKWKLAEDYLDQGKKVIVTIAELQEALYIALSTKADLIGVS